MLNKLSEADVVPSVAKTRPKENAQEIERQRMEAWISERVAAAKKGPVTEVVTLTPVLAALLLERNDGASDDSNRRIRNVHLDRIKHDIESGNWAFTGQSIVVAKNGKFNDGQHRCRAVVETGRSIVTVIVFGPERNTRMRLDMGAPRSVGDFLSMQGYHDTNALGSIAGMIWSWQTHKRLPTGGGVQRATKADALQVLKDHESGTENRIVESLMSVSRNNVHAVCSKPVLAFAHYAIWQTAGRKVADAFLDGVIEGVSLEKNSPVLYCRNRLIEMRSTVGGGGAVATANKAELLLRSYNFWRRNELITRIPLSGRLPELEA